MNTQQITPKSFIESGGYIAGMRPKVVNLTEIRQQDLERLKSENEELRRMIGIAPCPKSDKPSNTRVFMETEDGFVELKREEQ